MNEKCSLCGLPMPEGEEMFKYHGYSGPCPGPALNPTPSPAAGMVERWDAWMLENLAEEGAADHIRALYAHIDTLAASNAALGKLATEQEALKESNARLCDTLAADKEALERAYAAKLNLDEKYESFMHHWGASLEDWSAAKEENKSALAAANERGLLKEK